MESTNFTMPMYKATSEENNIILFEILKKHIPTLREYGLISDSPAISEDQLDKEIELWLK